MKNARLTKVCVICGRPFAWRKKWARCWADVRYCSERCRRERGRAVHQALEKAIRELLDGRSGSICPAEAARRVAPDNWRPLLDATRAAGRRLAGRGELVVLQRGQVVDPGRARGAIRYARGAHFGSP